jgi:hypothetical protein
MLFREMKRGARRVSEALRRGGRLGFDLKRKGMEAVHGWRGARLESDTCLDAIGQSGGGIECSVESGVRSKARLAWERTVSVKTQGFG